MKKTNKMGDFAKTISKENVLKSPIQENIKGIIKPVEKTFLLSLHENKLTSLKQKALDQKTTVRGLINSAIDEKFFK
jgi:hypothetical protein